MLFAWANKVHACVFYLVFANVMVSAGVLDQCRLFRIVVQKQCVFFCVRWLCKRVNLTVSIDGGAKASKEFSVQGSLNADKHMHAIPARLCKAR